MEMKNKMKVEKQEDQECMLATIAALADRSLAEVRALACGYARVKTWNATLRGPKYWKTVRYLVRTLKVTGVPTEREWGAQRSSRMLAVLTASTPALVLPPTGRGSVTFKTRKGVSHICAFEDGRLYNSGNGPPDRPYTIKEFCNTFFQYMVCGIFLDDPVTRLREQRRKWGKAYRDRKRRVPKQGDGGAAARRWVAAQRS